MINNQTISQVANEVGLSTKTIRYYESVGVIKTNSRAPNGYRVYSERDIERLKLVKRARDLGLPISDIKTIVSKCVDKGCEPAQRIVASKIPSYVNQVDSKISELKRLKQDLLSLEEEYKHKKTWEHSTETCCEIIPLERKS